MALDNAEEILALRFAMSGDTSINPPQGPVCRFLDAKLVLDWIQGRGYLNVAHKGLRKTQGSQGPRISRIILNHLEPESARGIPRVEIETRMAEANWIKLQIFKDIQDTTSSRAIMMSAPMSFCDSMDFSGVSSIRLPGFFGSSNSTPASVITASFSRETIWKPPLSVKMLPFHFIKLCSPPHLRNSSQVGRLAKWKVFPSKMRHPSVFMSSEDMPLMVPWVPTGMKTGVRTSPWGNVTVDARARPQVASKWKTKGLKYRNLPAVPTLKITTSLMALPIDLLALQKHVPNLTPCWQLSRVKFQPRVLAYSSLQNVKSYEKDLNEGERERGPPSTRRCFSPRANCIKEINERSLKEILKPQLIYIYIIISVRFDSFKFIPEEPAKDQIPGALARFRSTNMARLGFCWPSVPPAASGLEPPEAAGSSASSFLFDIATLSVTHSCCKTHSTKAPDIQH